LAEHNTEEQPIGYWSLVRDYRDWRYLWFGQIVNLLGDWFNLIASATLLAQLTGSGFALGALFVIRMLAPFLISPLAGILTDRYNRKHILIWCDVLRVFVVAGFLFVRDPSDAWLLYTLTAIQLAVGGVFFTARRAITPDLVPTHAIGAANAVGSATWSVMLAFGAAIGGVAAGTWGIYQAFAIDSVTFILSGLLILKVAYTARPGIEGDDRSGGAIFRQYADGLRYLKHNRDILAIVAHKPILSLFLSVGLEIVQVRISKDIFPIGEGGGISLGLMYAVSGVGSGLGPIFARSFSGDRVHAMRDESGDLLRLFCRHPGIPDHLSSAQFPGRPLRRVRPKLRHGHRLGLLYNTPPDAGSQRSTWTHLLHRARRIHTLRRDLICRRRPPDRRLPRHPGNAPMDVPPRSAPRDPVGLLDLASSCSLSISILLFTTIPCVSCASAESAGTST